MDKFSEAGSVVEALERTRELLATGGWIQGKGRTTEGRCLTRALAESTMEYFKPALSELAWTLHSDEDGLNIGDPMEPVRSLQNWNDDEGRSLAGVLELIDTTTDRLKVPS